MVLNNKPILSFINHKSVLIGISLLSCFEVISQEPVLPIKPDETEITDKLENIAENTDAVLDYSELIEDLKYYKQYPLNLNYATQEDLEKLFFLNEIQIFNLLSYRENYGLFVSIFELQAIEGFDKETINLILPFVKIAREKEKMPVNLKRLVRDSRNEFILRYQQVVEQQKGFRSLDDSTLLENPNAAYLGSKQKLYFRYGYSYFNKIRWGITAEKDAGEVFLKNQVNDSIQSLLGNKLKNGFDFTSIHFSVRDMGILKAFTIGDFQLQFGQGLTMWSSLAFGKSADATNIKRFAGGVRPYTSSDENRYFRGAAATIGSKNIEISAFFSSRKIDASVEKADSVSGNERYAQTLQESGLHRTMNELLKKDAINLILYGGNVTYKNKRLKLGVTGYYSKFDIPFTAGTALYEKFDFTGFENMNGGIDYSYLLRKVNIFGEVAVSKNGSWAQLHGLTASLHPRVFVTLLYRNYQKDYQNFFSNAFAEGSSSVNEKGFYTGFRVLLHSKWTLYGYVDQFNFPWIKYRVAQPSQGNEFLTQLDYQLSEKVKFYLRFKQKNKQISQSSTEGYLAPLVSTRRNNLRINIWYLVSPSIALSNRLEYLTYRQGEGFQGNGFLIYQDVKWTNPPEKLSLFFRYALFDTDSYDERIYAYENDVLYAFSVPAYYNKGTRVVLLLNFKPSRKIGIWLRYSLTKFRNQQSIGSGLDEIDGNHKSEVKAQVIIKL
ncbi:MAG: helix-hairpin-helix domain-containing protein [Bacteroidales bacterium]|nr:helix-hairpin-helix domain-containing protein [Bacteroidales bacterium]